ncbi:MAG: hypothetical protein M1150_01585 [Patescibacteria group bacterium]|nr:hypothetical protein [Patescibacteria group bacterium]
MLISITGPSGIGKGYLMEKVQKIFPFVQELTWWTTRPLRWGEYQRSNRKSVSKEEFRSLEAVGELILVQNLYGYHYGVRSCDLSLCQEKVYWTELQIDNLLKAFKLNLPIISLALIPFEVSFLRRRLEVHRKTETPGEIEQRLALAEKEIEKIKANRTLFSAIIEVTAETEDLVVPRLIEVVKPILNEGGS